MTNEKGGLIKKKKKHLMQPAVPVKKTQDMDFSYSESVKKEAPVVEPKLVKETEDNVAVPVRKVTKVAPSVSRTNLGISSTNTTKSIKVPTFIHSEINLLGSFMDENKAYVILQELIDSYVRNELTNRQQRQFDFMLGAFNEDK